MALQANTDFRYNSGIATVFCELYLRVFIRFLIWVVTVTGFFLKEADKELQQYTTDDGLPSNVIYGILEDSYGRLWVGPNQGLSCFEPENVKCAILR